MGRRSKSQSISPRRRTPPLKTKSYGSSGHRYSYSRSRSISLPSRRPPSPPVMSNDRRKCSSSRSSSRSPKPLRRSRRSLSSHNVKRSPVMPNRCIGVFGLNVNTTQAQIREIFSKYGPIERIQVVFDAETKRSRGFCFIYYENLEDAKAAKNECCGLEVDLRRIRVDYSITQRAHTPTPGVYKGRPVKRISRRHDRGRDYHDRYRDGAYESRSHQPRMPSSPATSHSCSHRHSRRSRSRSNYYTERSRRHGHDYSSRSRSRSYTPRKRSRY